MAEHQLMSQKKYVTKLRTTSKDVDLIEQEELVEKQLYKRQVS